MRLLVTPTFARAAKKLRSAQKPALDSAVRAIADDPTIDDANVVLHRLRRPAGHEKPVIARSAQRDEAIQGQPHQPTVFFLGDLAGGRVFKFRLGNQLCLLAYAQVDKDTVKLLALGSHEARPALTSSHTQRKVRRPQQRAPNMQLGALIPLNDIGADRGAVRDYACTMEDIGYHFIEAPDHVLGVNAGSRPGWDMTRNTSTDLFHDPFVLFGFLAGCTSKLGFATGVLILPQRQTALVAKQAACLDILCGGRFRLGIGVGWNEAEFVALGENFHNRGCRSEEQVQVMQKLWSQPHVTFEGKYHRIEDAGINPRPGSGTVPVWFGGHHERTLPRIAKWGDGWMPNAYPPGDEALRIFDELRNLTRQAGRAPEAVGIEVWTSCGAGTPDDWRKEAAFWKQAGVTHLCLTTTFNRRHHTRIAGHTLADHLDALKRYRDAVGVEL